MLKEKIKKKTREMEELKNKVNRNLFKFIFRKRKINNDLKKRCLMKWLMIIKKKKYNEKILNYLTIYL